MIAGFAVCFGIFLGICLLKFGNPPIMEQWVTAPKDPIEFIVGTPWPISWGYTGLAVVTVFGLLIADWGKKQGRWLLWILLAWLGWQIVATVGSLDDNLSTGMVKHFAACVVCFALGFFCLSRSINLWPFWTGIFCALLFVIWSGWGQHFGGLKATKEYFMLYIYPTLHNVPAEYLNKMSKGRIFATFFYPNALAGGMLLLLPPTVALLWHTERFTRPARLFLIGAVALGCLSCLFWSESKGGWLLALILTIVALLNVRIAPRHKALIIAAILLLGGTGFVLRHYIFFQRGATSVSARFDYWSAALRTAAGRPVTGTGPGTFYLAYEAIKKPESETSRLVHNDYLEQASDSGIPGFVLYCVFAAGSLLTAMRRQDFTRDWVTFCLWLGVLGFFLHEFVEFSLYIPSLAWPAFTFAGWLVADRVAISRPEP